MKHGLRGTFYIPRSSQRPAMSAAQVRQLAQSFDIGAHTLRHLPLTELDPDDADAEVAGSKAWIEDTIGQGCSVFCPPLGRFARDHLQIIGRAGFLGIRTVEFLSLDYPRRRDGLLIMPTTIQAHPHTLQHYFRNMAKRAAFRNLWLYILHGRSTDWGRLAESLVEHVLRGGGVFHLWGHSWELEENDQWKRLEDVMKTLAACRARAVVWSNRDLCEAMLPVPGNADRRDCPAGQS